jgi:hypothetical protein
MSCRKSCAEHLSRVSLANSQFTQRIKALTQPDVLDEADAFQQKPFIYRFYLLGRVNLAKPFFLLAAANQCPKLIPIAALLALQDVLMHFVNRMGEFFDHRLESGLTT